MGRRTLSKLRAGFQRGRLLRALAPAKPTTTPTLQNRFSTLSCPPPTKKPFANFTWLLPKTKSSDVQVSEVRGYSTTVNRGSVTPDIRTWHSSMRRCPDCETAEKTPRRHSQGLRRRTRVASTRCVSYSRQSARGPPPNWRERGTTSGRMRKCFRFARKKYFNCAKAS